MARTTFEAWIPEEYDSAVIQQVNQMSAIEGYATRIPMTSHTTSAPRSGSATVAVVAKGGTYGEDSSTNDDVVLTERKIGSAFRIAEEDIDDSLASVVATKQAEWGNAYAPFLDNACLGVSAAGNGTTVPFTSVYRALSQTDSGVSYTANANIVTAGAKLGAATIVASTGVFTVATPHGLAIGDRVVFGTFTTTTGATAGTPYFVITVPSTTTFTVSATEGGAAVTLTNNGSVDGVTRSAVTYANLSNVLKKVETGGWFDPSKLLVIAHPAFKDELRMVRDTNQRPILVESASAATPDTIFGYTARWSRGAAKHVTASSAPTGNPLMVVVNRDLLRLGVRSGPESVFIDGRNGLGALTDESILKVRARRAFVLGMQHGAAILEATA
mgnify:FL=1